MVEVVAALIWRKEKFLICRRPPYKARGNLWEFVGGKVEAGESKQEALRRECREELAIGVKVEKVYCEVTHAYPDLTVHLTLFEAAVEEGEPQLLEHTEMRWIAPSEIDGFAFCPADGEILEKIKRDAGA